ncbi:2245_t:CDS:1, partial [Cetraspora pellucida]
MDIYIIATVLDPRLKLDYYEENNWSKDFINSIKATILQIYKNNYESSFYEATNYNQDNMDNDDDLLLDYIYRKKQRINQQNEVELYLEAPQAMRKQDIQWWEVHEAKYPNLARMARDYLAITATSVPVEQVFSGGTDLISVKRCSLNANFIRA